MTWYKKKFTKKTKTSEVLCPICNSRMVIRKNTRTNQEFYGCSNYRGGCKGTRPVEKPQAVPQARPQNPIQQPNPQPINNENSKPWVLSELLNTGEPVVARETIDKNWEVREENGKDTVFPRQVIQTYIKSIKDKFGKSITSKNPEELFRIYREINNQNTKEEPKENGIKGRIPEDKISPYQKQIETSFTDTQKNIMINALAGTGKTTVLKHIASFMKPGEQWLYIVFNKKNQLESQGKFPSGVTVMTSHGFLGQVLKDNGESYQTLPNTKYIFQDKIEGVSPNAKKIDLILDDVMSEGAATNIPQNLRYSASFIVKNIVSLCKAYSVNPFSNDKENKVLEIIRNYGINTKIVDQDKQGKGWGGEEIALTDYTAELIDASLKVLDFSIPGRCNKPNLNYVRDFDDTLWFAAINPNIIWPKYDVVLADEVQDFNECQSIMLRKLSETGARVVAVGDPNQSIYRFRGSDSKSFEKVSESIQASPNGGLVHELPTNYRSGKKIIEFVRNSTHVKNLQAGLNFDGEVTQGVEKEEAINSIIKEVKTTGKLSMPTAIIGRTNSPLAKSAIELMKSNVDFIIIGKDFSKDLTDFVYKTTKKSKRNKFDSNYLSNINIQNLLKVMENFTSEYERVNANIPSKAVDIKEQKEMLDLMQEVVMFLANSGYQNKKRNRRVNNAQDFIDYLKDKFSGIDEENSDPMEGKDPLSFVTLTSAHKSKGLEFDRVFILEPNLFPHPKAKSEEDLAQEQNAKYVAFTRAMKQLHVLAPSSKNIKKEKQASKKGWYKKSQVLTPQQIQQYHSFKTPSGVNIRGSGLSSSFKIPGTSQTISGQVLMNQVISRMQKVLTNNGVHTIDTSPVSKANAIGVAKSSEPGTVHVDIQKIFDNAHKSAFPSTANFDGVQMDKNVSNDIVNKITQILTNEIANTAAHESKHNIDYLNSFPSGQFVSQESGAESFGNQMANQYFRIPS